MSEARPAWFPRLTIKSLNAEDDSHERPAENVRIVGRARDGAVARFSGKD